MNENASSTFPQQANSWDTGKERQYSSFQVEKSFTSGSRILFV